MVTYFKTYKLYVLILAVVNGQHTRLADQIEARKAAEDAAFSRDGGMHPTGRMYVTPKTGDRPLPPDLQAEVDRVAYQNNPQTAAQPSMQHVLGAYAGTQSAPTVKQRLAAARLQTVGPQVQGDATIVGSRAWIEANNAAIRNPAYGDAVRKKAMQNLADAQSGKLPYGSTQSMDNLVLANTKADLDHKARFAQFQRDHEAAVREGVGPLGKGDPKLYAMQNGRTPAERQAIYQSLLDAQKKQAMALRNASMGMGAYAAIPPAAGASPISGDSPPPMSQQQAISQLYNSVAAAAKPVISAAQDAWNFIRPFNGKRGPVEGRWPVGPSHAAPPSQVQAKPSPETAAINNAHGLFEPPPPLPPTPVYGSGLDPYGGVIPGSVYQTPVWNRPSVYGGAGGQVGGTARPRSTRSHGASRSW